MKKPGVVWYNPALLRERLLICLCSEAAGLIQIGRESLLVADKGK